VCLKGADELVDLIDADCPLTRITLGLHIEKVRAERVLADDTIDTTVCDPAEVLCRSFP